MKKRKKKEEQESEIETGKTEVEVAPEELFEKGRATGTEQRVVDNQKKDSQDRENAEAILNTAIMGKTSTNSEKIS